VLQFFRKISLAPPFRRNKRAIRLVVTGKADYRGPRQMVPGSPTSRSHTQCHDFPGL
jgi:hypothetical protein